MKKQISVNIALAITLIAMTVTFSVTMVIAMTIFDNTVSSVVEKQALYSRLSELDTYVRDNYYGEINDARLNDRISQGYLNGIGDSYSIYYTEKEYSELLEYEQGVRVGIGVQAIKDADGYFRIMRVYPGSPAEKEGVQRGGKITAVGDVDTRTLSSVRALNPLLRDEPGTTVEFTCLYGSEEITYSIQHTNYSTPTVEYEKVGDYAYFRIHNFGPSTYTDFDYMVSEAAGDGAVGFVFDLRGNPGDNLRAAASCIDMLCPLGVVAKSEDKQGSIKNVATSDEEFIDLPMTVIVNGDTAAAAELFAMSVRDLNGGTIVGTKTMGKGMLQSQPQRLSDGSAVVITVGKLLTGRDESFEGTGITPDIEVAMTLEDEYALYEPLPRSDPQILRAYEVVRGMIIAQGGNAPAVDLSEPAAAVSAVAGGDSSLPESGSLAEGDASAQPDGDGVPEQDAAGDTGGEEETQAG